jgi:M6 family metalloprotease-like protein
LGVKRIIALLLSFVFFIPQSSSFATIKAGDLCKQPGTTLTVKSVKLTCLKSGKKLIWTKKKVKKVENQVPPKSSSGSEIPAVVPAKFLSTEPLPIPTSPDYKVGNNCAKVSWPIVGYLSDGNIGYVACSGPPNNLRYATNTAWIQVDPATRKPLIPIEVSEYTLDTRQPHAYIYPTNSTQKPTSALSTSAEFSNMEPCRLKEEKGARINSNMGFPIKDVRVKLDDRVVVQVIPVDFADVRADTDPGKDLEDALSAIEKFWERQATTKADIVIQTPNKYINLKKNVLDYGLNIDYSNFGNNGGKNYWPFADEAAAAIDDVVDFTNVDIVIIATPPAITDKQIGTFVAQKAIVGESSVLNTKEKIIYNFLIRGADEYRDISNWIHEFGHMFGLTDFGHDGPADASQNSQNAGKGFFDIMTAYRSAELYVWHRFLLGVLENSQINCVTTTSKTTHWLQPVASSGNVQKGVVIPLSTTEAIVVESRRRMGYDATLGREGEGALVYKVDTSAEFGEQTGKSSSYVLSPDRKSNRDIRFSVPLKIGDSVSYKGWTIKVIEAGKFGDVITVEKL